MLATALALVLVAYAPTHALDLQTASSGGATSWTTFSNGPTIDSDFTLEVDVYNVNTGWFAGSRLLAGRTGQAIVRVTPASTGGVFSVLLTGTNNVTCTRTIAMPTLGKHWYDVQVVKQGTDLHVMVDGIERALGGACAIPLHLKQMTTPWQVGGSDFLKARVANLRIWDHALPAAQRSASWARAGTCDLSGPCPAPLGALVQIDTPFCQNYLDAFPLAPNIGTCTGTVVCNTPPCGATLTTTVPRSPVRPEDDVAYFRFDIKSGGDGFDAHPYWAFPGIALTGTGILAGFSLGDGHNASNITYTAESQDGSVWPWPLGQSWPDTSNAITLAIDPGPYLSARGSAICALSSGRVLHFSIIKPSAGAIPPGARHPILRHRDPGQAWTVFSDVPNAGNEWMSMPSGGGCVELADGRVLKGMYKRNCQNGVLNPCVSEPWYTAIVAASSDGGLTWTESATIATGKVPFCPEGFACQNDTQFEEPEVDWILEGCPGSIDGSCLAALIRVDYPQPGRTFSSYSYDEGATWTPPRFAFYGYNFPNWKETCEGAIITATRSPFDNNLTRLMISYDKMQTWVDGPLLSQPQDGDTFDVGHTIAVDYGTCDVHVMRASERGTSLAILQYMRLKPVWGVCGDGALHENEVCDDGNTTTGDGCTDQCDVEPGYACAVPGQPCDGIRGDGLIRGTEQCDNGVHNGDMGYGSPPCRADGTLATCSAWD